MEEGVGKEGMMGVLGLFLKIQLKMNVCFLLPQSAGFLIGYGPLYVITRRVLSRESLVLPTHARVFRCIIWKCLIFTIVAPTRLSIWTHFRPQHNLIRCTIMGCLSSLAGKVENRNKNSPIIMGVSRSSWTTGTKPVDFTHSSHLARVLSATSCLGSTDLIANLNGLIWTLRVQPISW